MTSPLTPVMLTALFCLAFSAGVEAQNKFSSRLSKMPVDFINVATMTGTANVTAVLSGTTLAVTGSFEGLSSPATIARVHHGIGPRGVRGPAIADLTITSATSGKISGSLTLTPDQVKALQGGRIYVQLHSEKAPDGNLWGWLLNPEL